MGSEGRTCHGCLSGLQADNRQIYCIGKGNEGKSEGGGGTLISQLCLRGEQKGKGRKKNLSHHREGGECPQGSQNGGNDRWGGEDLGKGMQI